MSVVWTLRDSTLKRTTWDKLAAAWTNRYGADLFDEAAFEDEGDHAVLFIAGKGSTRGVVIDLHGTAVEIRVSALASPADWRRCYSLCATALKNGGGMLEREDGTVVPLPHLTAAHAEADAREELAANIAAMARHDGVSLPCGSFNIVLRPGELSGTPDEVCARLAARFERYATAYQVTMVVTLPEHGRACAVPDVGCIIPTLDAVMPQLTADDATSVLAWKDFTRILGTHAEPVGDDRIYVPPFADLPAAVMAALRSTASQTVPGGDRATTAASQADERLVLAPIVVILMVAGSDGDIGEKELQVGVRFMAGYDENARVSAIFAQAIEQLEPLVAQATSPIGPITMLAHIGEAIHGSLPARDAAAYRQAIIALATAVASASGGFLGVFGSKISKDEASTISLITTAMQPPA